jgi:prevent-host-death family protein
VRVDNVSGMIVNISEAKAQLSKLVERAEHGDRVVIGRAGRPVAVLVAYHESPERRVLGGWKSSDVWIADDFDAPLPADVMATFDGDI